MQIVNTYQNVADCSLYKSLPQCLGRVAEQIQKYAKDLFEILYAVVTFPCRYIGSKTWSIPGVIMRLPQALYQRIVGRADNKAMKDILFCSKHQSLPARELTREEAKAYVCPLAMAACTHACDEATWANPLGYRIVRPSELQVDSPCIESKTLCFFDRFSGLKMTVMENNDQVVVGIGAVAAYESETPGEKKYHLGMVIWMHIVAGLSLFGGEIAAVQKADKLFSQLVKSPRLQGKKITLVGVCFGGMIAQFLSLKHRIHSYCINCLPMGAGLQWRLGRKALEHAERFVTQVRVTGDYFDSERKVWKIGDAVTSLLGIKVPGNFGHSYLITTPYTTLKTVHERSFGSLMWHLGFDQRTKPNKMDQGTLDSLCRR